MSDKKNIVVIPMIIPKDKNLDKFGGWEWMLNSKTAWEFWCKKNNYELVIFDEPSIEDTTKYKITVQRWFDIFDFLDKKKIEYDQVCMVDASYIPKWDCPDFFELTDNKFATFQEQDNFKWVYESIQGYKKLFNNYELDILKYFHAGFVIFNKSHKSVFEKFKNMYINNIDELTHIQGTLRRGTDQTPLNYVMSMNNVDMKFLPMKYRVSHLPRKEFLSYNWQLNEDKTPFFIKYGFIWYMQGFPKEQRNRISLEIWNMVKHNYDESYVLNKIQNKDNDKDTTSNKFKEDILKYFSNTEYKDKTILELGSCKGNTTRVYAECFKHVIGVEHNPDNIQISKERCSDVNNVKFILADVYSNTFKFPVADVVHIDAGHNHDQVCRDIDICVNELNKPILIFDDCSAKRYPDGSIGNTIRTAVDQKISEGKIQFIKYIGANNGYKSGNGKVLTGIEGMICKVI